MGKIFGLVGSNGSIERVSRWIKIHNAKVSKRNSLAYYASDENGYREGQEKFDGSNGLFVYYFQFQGVKYALDRFISCHSMWASTIMFYDENDKLNYISGYDEENYYNPLLIEIDDCGEYVRVYQEI